MLVVGTFSPFLRSSNLYSAFLTAKKDFRRHAIFFDFLGNLFPYIALVLVMILTKDPLWLVIVYFVSNTTIGIILYRKIVKIYNPDQRNIDTASLSYGKHLSLMSIMSGIASNIDQILVFHYLGAAQLAIYNFAIAIPDQSKGPLKGLNKLIFPKFVERDDHEIRTGMRNKFLWLLMLSVVLILIYILVAPYIFSIFFPKYMSSVFYSQIFSISLLSIPFSPTNVYLAAKKKVKEQYIVYSLTSIVQIIAIFFGIFFWGLLGLIVARVITRIFSGLINVVFYKYSFRKELAG